MLARLLVYKLNAEVLACIDTLSSEFHKHELLSWHRNNIPMQDSNTDESNQR